MFLLLYETKRKVAFGQGLGVSFSLFFCCENNIRTNTVETKGLRRWLILALISFSGGVSFDLAYLRYIYQIPMVEFMGFTNTEVGLIMSSFGIAAIALYAPSGLIADKFSHKWMITLSMIATGLLGLLMATYPPFWVMIMIQIGFGITTVLTLWSVTIKAASLLGSADEQGSIMGWMEGFRGVGVMTLAVFTMWVFSKIGESNPNSLRTVILIYSSVYIILGVLCWFFVPHGRHEQSDQNSVSSNILQDIVTVLKRKITWYCSAIVFWCVHYLRHPELLNQLPDRTFWHVASCSQLYGSGHQ